MTAITTALINELREAAGAGPLDCKQALAGDRKPEAIKAK